jgi:hypothetical protein
VSTRRLFLSMVSDEFRGCRQLLTRDLERGQVDVATQEKWGTLGLTTLEKIDHFITDCSAVIHLVGDGLGQVPPAEAIDRLLALHPDFLAVLGPSTGLTRELLGGCSYTQFEAYLAVYHKRRLHIYRPDASAPREPKFQSDDKQLKSQKAHFERIRALGRDRDVFLTDERLSSFVLADLNDILPPRGPTGVVMGRRHLRHEAAVLIGRQHWLKQLDEAWADPHCHAVVIRAWGGAGKTALVSAWMAEMDHKGWREATRVFDWSFYSQGTRREGETAVTGDFFIAEALKFFGDPNPQAGSPEERGDRLARLVAEHRSLLVLDGVEPLQHPPGPMAGYLADPAVSALLRGLSAQNAGLCIVTTREPVADVQGRPTVPLWELDELSEEAGAALLHFHGVRRAGSAELQPDDELLKCASREVDNHALSLTLTAKYLALAVGGDVLQRDTIRYADADQQWVTKYDPKSPYGHAFRVMSSYERWLLDPRTERTAMERRGCRVQLAILRLMGLFNRPAPADCLRALRQPPAIAGLTDDLVNLSDREWNIAVTRLEENDLVRRHGTNAAASADGLDAHPLIREFFATQLRATQSAAFRSAHARLFDHLCATTPPRPDTLDGLQPLYQAVVHGCLAGRHHEADHNVYDARILRGTGKDGFYSSKMLGAMGANLGAVAAFFDEPWTRVSPNLTEADGPWLLGEAAFYLRALGRLTEALQPMRTALEMFVRQQGWRQAAIQASNLSQLGVALGRLGEAVADGRQSITHADQSGDPFQSMVNRATAADALHQRGERVEAGALFAEAERRQQEWQPQFPLLYSVAGFLYRDWLLVPAERAAWRALLGFTRGSGAGSPGDGEDPAASCAGVERQANTIFDWRRGPSWNSNADSLLDIALNHLTLGRVGLVRALLAGPVPQPALDLSHVHDAVHGLRNAGHMDDLPRGLLTAALYHFVRGEHDRARALLDETQQIAERGPMLLVLADVHLHRARLFRDRAELATAAKLIRELGYGRRFDELADAEEALGKE